MDRGVAVFCPICLLAINEELENVRCHVLEEHGIRVSENRPGGFGCACGHRMDSFRSWKHHVSTCQDAPAFGVILGPEQNDPGRVLNLNQDANEDMDMHDAADFNENVNDIVNEDSEEIGDPNEEQLIGERNQALEVNEEELIEEVDLALDDLETLGNGKKDPQHAIAQMIVNMRSVPAMTRIGVRRAMLGADLVLKVNNLSLKQEVSSFLTSLNLGDTPEAQALLKKFDVRDQFQGVKSNQGQISVISKYYEYLKPRTIPVGVRHDLRLGEEGVYRQVPVESTFEYVSPIDVCKLVRRKSKVHDYVTSRKPSEDGMLYGFTDGDRFRNSTFFKDYPDAYQLTLYYDGVGTTRPLGSKAGLYEVGNFSMSILNMPPGINCTLSGIHPVVLANVQDCKGTFEDVLYLLRDDLIRLENGVPMFLNGGFIEIRGAIVAVKGDNKAVHEILGFLASGARHFCRLCLISRIELHSGEVILGVKRTKEMYDIDIQRISRNAAHSTQCGLKCRTVLEDLQHFTVTDNELFDLMHDASEGVTIMLIRLALKDMVCRSEPLEPLIDCDRLNAVIGSFNYGKQNVKDIPSGNFSKESLSNADTNHKQLSNAGQTMNLHRALPFLLDEIGDDKIPEDHAPSQMLILLAKILEIASAHMLPRNIIPYLRRLLEVFHRSWFVVFPTVNPTNKFHHLQHIPDNLLASGPQRQFWCFREEAKNCPIKRHLNVTNNYVNACKTTMEQSQIFQTKVWGTASEDIVPEVSHVGRRTVSVSTLPVSGILQALGFEPDYQISIADAAFSNGYEFRTGEYVVCVKSSDKLETSTPHQFGKIRSIVCPERTTHIWLAVQAYKTLGLVERFNAYKVQDDVDAPIHLIDIRDLPLHPPISRWKDITGSTYLSLKHAVF